MEIERLVNKYGTVLREGQHEISRNSTTDEESKDLPRKTLLYIELDDVPQVNEFVASIKHASVDEQVEQVSQFIKSKFKNAIAPKNQSLPDGEQQKIAEAMLQKPGTKLSQAVERGYGVCVEYHALGYYMFDKLGVPVEFQHGERPGGSSHTYLDIQVDNKWQIFDPFAEVYCADYGRPDLKRLDPVYYRSSKSLKKAE